MTEIFEYEIRVGWGDCDPARIVYTARIPAFALEAIDAFWERVSGGDGWYQLELDRNLGTPFVHMTLDFRRPVTPRHRLICRVWPSRLGATSVRLRVEGRQADLLCFDGSFVEVFTIADKFEKRVPPEALVARLKPYFVPDAP